MAKFCSDSFMLQNETSPGVWASLLGTDSVSFSLASGTVDISDKGSSHWVDLLAGCGQKSASISASGFMTDDTTYSLVQASALAGTLLSYRIISGRGDVWAFNAAVTSVERAGEINAAETMSISLESSGQVSYTAGP